MKLTLPLPPNMANARTHWAAKHRKRKAYMLACTCADSRRPDEPIAPAVVHATLYTWAKMDEDNLTARLKWTIDWLVDRQILLDDHPSAMTLGTVSQAVDRKNQRVEITIEEVDSLEPA